MIGRRKGVGAGLAALLAAGLAACAPQQQTTPAAAPAAGAPAAQSAWWAGLAESLARRDHPAAMAHCAQMREQVRQGGQVPPDMQRMQRICDHMDHAMGSMRGRPPG